jgi:iron complex outermembrane receptor protein
MRGLSPLLTGAASVALAAVGIAGPAAAQQTAELGVEEITVTARKVGERLIDVPVAITALTADALESRGIRGYNELNDFVPGLKYENSAANRNDRSFHTITMRGMYPGDSPNRQSVTAFVDGVAIPGASIPGLAGIERVEVVNGPQSAYFGRSTFAGAINFITKQPGNAFHAMADLSYASYNTFDGTGSVEGPVVADRLGVRATVRYYTTDGRYDNAGYGGKLGARETTAGVLNFQATPSDALKLRGMFAIWKDSDGPSAQAALNEQDYNCNPGGNGRVVGGKIYVCGGLSEAPTARMAQNINPGVPPAQIVSGLVVLPDNFINHMGLERREWIANLSGDYTFGNGYTASANFGRNHLRWAALTDTYNRPPDGTNYYSTVYLPYDIHNTSAEARLASPQTDRFRFLLGGNFYQESIFFQVRASRPPVGVFTTLTQPTDYRADTYGIFGSASYEIVDRLTLSAEARYQWDKIHHIVKIANGAEAQNTFKSFSPRVILNYKLTDTADAYASFARGTRPGTFNLNYVTLTPFQQQQIAAQIPVPLAIGEEKLNTYEAGLKGDFMDRRLRILGAAYYGEWRGRQINQNIPFLATPTATTNSTITLTLANGSTNLWGLELQSTFKATKRLTLEGTLNWAATSIRNTACAECVTISGIANPIGNRMERYPAWSGTLSASYDQPISADWTATLRGDYIYVGRMYAEATNLVWINPAHRFNLRLGVSNGTYTVEFFGKNVFDDKTPSNILRNANPNALASQGSNLIILAPPEYQTFGVRGIVRY